MSADQPPTTKAAILERIGVSGAAFDALVSRVPKDRLEQRGSIGDWSVRDVVAHVSADEQSMAARFGAMWRGDTPTALEVYGTEEAPASHYNFATQEGRNAWQYERLKDLPLAEVLRRAVESRRAIVAAIEAFEAAEFGRPYTLLPNSHVGSMQPAESTEGLTFPLWQWLRGNTWHHYEDHATGIRDYLSRISPR